MFKKKISLFWITNLIMVVVLQTNSSCSAAGRRRQKRLLSMFNVVRFENGPCSSQEPNLSGTCYTEPECLRGGGRPSGACANGFGVCCLFELGCDFSSSENCTYFSSSDNGIGGDSFFSMQQEKERRQFCTAKVCKCAPDICQLRMDFLNFALQGPSTASNTIGNLLNGALIDDTVSSPPVSAVGRCETEFFSVTNTGGVKPPVICGQNSGEHLYVDASSNCNEVSMFRATSSNSPGSWLIRIIQIPCSSPLLAPSGCTQYFFGATEGTVRTFNYAGGRHLADQSQAVCIRRERDTCSICWTALTAADFSVSGAGSMGVTSDLLCCGYGSAGDDTRGYDCAVIPQASNAAGQRLKASRFCGSGRGLAEIGSRTAQTDQAVVSGVKLDVTICSRRLPFQLRFVSDGFEFAAESLKAQKGFQLQYKLNSCPTTV